MTKAEEQEQPLVDFETALAELEEIVRQLESGELPLADSLASYEKGVERLRQCYQTLDAAEARVRLLSVSASGQLEERPFDPPATGNPSGG